MDRAGPDVRRCARPSWLLISNATNLESDIMNTKGIVPGTFKPLPHPYMRNAWSVSGLDDRGMRTLSVRDEAGGICHWHTRSQAENAAVSLNAATTA